MGNEQLAKARLDVAKTYLDNAEKLIYSYAGKTFFSGYALYDPEYGRRGNIDCSTYMHLVLQGIPYEKSPYASGQVEDAFLSEVSWREKQYLEELRENGPIRRACGIAEYYYRQGKTFTDRSELKPGDLVFYQAPEEVMSFYVEHGAFMAISHIGMAAEDTSYIYHSTGYPEKEQSEREGMQAIQYTHILDGRTPNLYAHL